MMNLKYGDIWFQWDRADLFLVPSNATITQGELVMDGGAGGYAKDKFNGLSESLGSAIMKGEVLKTGDGYAVYRPYYLLISPRWPAAKLGLFQTKDYALDQSDPFLISGAVDELLKWLPRGRDKLGRDPVVVMPMPGPDLEQGEVLEYLKKLPDNVEVWQRESQRKIMLPENHPLAPLLQPDYVPVMCSMLSVTREELDMMRSKTGIRVDGLDGLGRLQRYFLFKTFMETGDMDGAWHTSRNMLRELLSEN